MPKLLGLFFAVFCLTVGFGHSARAVQYLQASAIALAPPATNCTNDPSACLVIEGVTISVSNTVKCQNGGNACPDLFLAPTSGPGASVIIEAATGDVPGVSTLEPIFSYTCPSNGDCGGTYDLSVALNVSSTHTLTTVDGTLNGSVSVGAGSGDNTTDLNYNVTMGENVVPGGGSSNLCYTNPSKQSEGEQLDLNSPSFSCAISQTSLSVSKDLGLSGNTLMGPNSTLTLTSVVQSFVPAPEPASLATFLGGSLHSARRGAIAAEPDTSTTCSTRVG